jgi:hypothetical protein
MKKSTIVVSIAACLVVVALIIIALMPSILSSDMMKPFVIRQANQQLPGELQLESWSLSWLGGIQGQGIVYDNQTEGFLAQVSEIKAEKGLLGMIFNGGELGSVELVDPAVVFYLSEESTLQGSSQAPSSPSAPDSTPTQKDGAFIPVYYGKLNITNGAILTAAADGSETVIAKRLDLTLDAPGPDSPITYRFSAESGDSSGHASGEGSLVLAADEPLDLQKIQLTSNVIVKNWELKDALAIVAARAGLPSGAGRLNANVSLSGDRADRLDMNGQMAIQTLRLRGGPLRSDTPTVKGIVVDLNGSRTANTFSINKLTFRSSLASGSATASLDDENQQRLSGKADVDLAEVFSQFPATLKLREDTKITTGKMALSANIKSAPSQTTFDSDARIDRLQGISAGKKISWTKPVTVSARGQMGQEGLQLDNLSLRSSFLEADGRGDMHNMQVDLSADLKAALAELRKFIEIKQWDGSGNLNLNLKLNEKSENLNQARVKLHIDDFVLSRNRRPILARQVVRADLNADVQVAEVAADSKLIQPSLKIQSSVASGKLTAQQVARSASNSFPDAASLKLNGNINLQQLSSLLKTLNILSPQTMLAGKSNIKAGGDLADGRLTLANTRIETQKLIYRQDNKMVRENRLVLTTKGQIDLNNHSLTLAPVDIHAQAGKIHIPELAVADWTHAPNNIKVGGRADLDLDKLVQGYGDFIQLPKKTRLSGKGRFDFDMDFTHPKTQYMKLQGNVAPFKLVSTSLPTISEKKVSLNADVYRSPDGRNLTINKIELNSNALSLNAAGTLNQSGKNKILDAKGTMRPDMKLVSDYLKKTGRSQVRFTGKKATPFTLKLVSKGDRWEDPLKHLNFSGAFHVEAIEAYGMKLTPNDVPVRVAGAAAGAKFESPANGGQLDFQPTVDMGQDPYILSFKKNIDLLKDVQITQGLIDGVLAAIHPLFKDAVVPEGLLGLNMKHFSWPLSEKQRNQATFAGTLRLNGVRLNSTPFMADLLSIMGISERELRLVDQDIAFEAKNGRIELSPVTLEAQGSQLTMQGSVGFDKTIDFIARVPVTEKMVGRDGYRFLQGTTIRVPIRGTASRPRLDQTALQDATGDLIQQALRKNLEQGAQNLLQNLFKK